MTSSRYQGNEFNSDIHENIGKTIMADSTSEQRLPQFFVNGWVDSFFVGGLSILSFVVMWWGLSSQASPAWLTTLSTVCLVIGNWPHFAATSLRLYGSRDTIAQYPLTATLIPFFLLGTLLASFRWPEEIAPYFVKVFLIWSPYHFSGQTIGITLVYARRAGIQFSKVMRQALVWFVYGTFLVTTLRAEVSGYGSEFYGIRYPGFGLPVWAARVAEIFMWAAGLVFLICVLKWWKSHPTRFNGIIVLPAVTQAVWFVWGPSLPAYYNFVPFFHSVQYLLIAWAMQLVEKGELKEGMVSVKTLYSLSARWAVIVLAGGAGLFWLLPRMFEAITSAPLNFSLGVTIAAVQIHHFFVDGVIWKLRRKTVSQPLMVNIPQMFFRRVVRSEGNPA